MLIDRVQCGTRSLVENLARGVEMSEVETRYTLMISGCEKLELFHSILNASSKYSDIIKTYINTLYYHIFCFNTLINELNRHAVQQILVKLNEIKHIENTYFYKDLFRKA